MSDEFSEQQLKAILARVDEWYEAFAQSPEFARLSVSHQRKAGAITEFFARYTYEYLGVSPDEWDRSAVVECCTEILPRKVSAETSFFEAMAPVLGLFFGFLQDQSLLSGARALGEAVEELGDEIVASAEDRSHWGPAKHFVMAAHDAGVDIQDPAAMNTFVLQFNLQQVSRAQSRTAAPSSRPATRAAAAASPYDPCPCGSGKKYKFCCASTR